MKRPPEARELLEESSIIVHRTHDVEQARELARHFAGPLDYLDGDGDQVWVRTCPAAPGGDFAYFYRRASPDERGAFRAVIFSAETYRWWLPRAAQA